MEPSTDTDARITVRLPRNLVGRLGAVAATHDRSLSGELRCAIRAHLAAEGPQKDEDPDRRPGPVTTSAGGVGGHGSVYP